MRYRQHMARVGAPVTFRVPSPGRPSLQLAIRMGCIGTAALSGRFVRGGIVTSSNSQMCGNQSRWWGFVGLRNADGAIRESAGPGLAREIERLTPMGPEGEKLLPGSVRVTGAHALRAERLFHALGPSSLFRPGAESTLGQTYDHTFRLAKDLAVPCLALPALCCGVAGFPASVGARAALDAVGRATEDDALEGALSMVEFVLLDERVYAAFADGAHARWGKGTPLAVV